MSGRQTAGLEAFLATNGYPTDIGPEREPLWTPEKDTQAVNRFILCAFLCAIAPVLAAALYCIVRVV